MSDASDPYREMAIHDEHIPEELFSAFVARLPQVCVELILETSEGILLAKRAAAPRVWFWPGGRLYKGERLDDAAHRIARAELGIDVHLRDRYGPYAHFWAASAVEGSPSRHTVNIVYHVTPAADDVEITLDEQHTAYRFLTELEPGLHPYVRRYLDDHELLCPANGR